MSFVTGMYLGLANLIAMSLVRPWPLTLLGTVASVVNNNLVLYKLLGEEQSTRSPLIILSAGATVLCARSFIPRSPWEVVPYAMTYLTIATIPYFCLRPRKRTPPPSGSPRTIVVEHVTSTEVPVIRVESAPIAEERSATPIPVPPKSPQTDEDYDHIEHDALLP